MCAGRVARSGVYRRPRPASDNELALMRRIDEFYTAWPFSRLSPDDGAAGPRASDQPQAGATANAANGHRRARAAKPRTTKPAPGHKIYPYLLRNLVIERPGSMYGRRT